MIKYRIENKSVNFRYDREDQIEYEVYYFSKYIIAYSSVVNYNLIKSKSSSNDMLLANILNESHVKSQSLPPISYIHSMDFNGSATIPIIKSTFSHSYQSFNNDIARQSLFLNSINHINKTKICESCNATKTPEWRKGPSGKKK